MIPAESLAATFSAFSLIALAEIGDKSQLVCMTLAVRHRHWPVLLGSALAFMLLNLLAVLFGAGIAAWIPEQVMAGLVALLFGGFGLHVLFSAAGDCEEVVAVPGRSLLVTTLLLILVAEFGDKTQIAVAGLAGSLDPVAVWLGATTALLLVSALGIWAGRRLLQRLPLHWLQRAGGVVFLLFAIAAAWHGLTL